MKDKNYVINAIKEHNIKFISLWFTDILGFLKSFTINASEIETALNEGMGFDGSSIEGFARIDESDMLAIPDPKTFQIIPWTVCENVKMARMFCDIYTHEKVPYEGDPRYVLKRALKRAQDMGFTVNMGPELEYFYFKDDTKPVPVDAGGYFDLMPLDIGSSLRKETILALESMGIEIEYSHHEVAHSQHEIDLRYTDALTMADNAMTYRMVVKKVAANHGLYATFMPKPIFGQNGSGMHVHQSLFKDGKNVFFDAKEKSQLSITARKYIAGLLKHAPEFTLITNQWVNSYKRLVPGYEAPIYLTWAFRNRSDLIRVPAHKPGKEKSVRVEYRSPDPACNPYLAFAVMLNAGLTGIAKDYELVEPSEGNVYEMTENERHKLGIRTLPPDLYSAISLAEPSELIRYTLGDHVFEKLIENKKLEWHNYHVQISSYEIEQYLAML